MPGGGASASSVRSSGVFYIYKGLPQRYRQND